MKTQRILLVLTAANLVLFVFLLMQGRPALAQSGLSVLRGRALEIVDEKGQVRARINVEPASKMPDGSTYPEAVVFRMTDPDGRIRVKLGADEDGSGLLLANDSQQPGAHILADGKGSSLKLLNKDGRERFIGP